MKTRTWLVASVITLALSLTACASTETDTSGDSTPTSSDASSKKNSTSKKKDRTKAASSCGTKATDDCTPHIATGGKVRVDALTWKVTSVKSAASIGEMTYGLGEKADGRFVIIKLSVHSDRSESATLSDELVKLKIGGRTYSSDSDGTIAALGDGQDPFFFEDIGPDSDVKGTVVFDIPAGKLSKKMELRFGELGFGTTEGFIALKSLKA